ncbi:MAG: glycosyltransferase family 39 protein, partial [Chloroflexi bacterium]|nr:glycosyltransferase family 39 protein [Chloroflexota bacterium]
MKGRTLAWCAATLLALAAIGLQQQLWRAPDALTPLWWLLGTGVAFSLVVRYGLRPAPVRPGDIPSEPMDGPPSRWTHQGWLLLALTLVAEAAALALFRGEPRFGTLAWYLHLVACVLFLAGVWLATRTRLARLAGSWSRLDTLVVTVLTLPALVVRVWQLGAVPPGLWFDEAQFGLYGLRVLQDPTFRPVYLSENAPSPASYWYLMAPFLQVFGRDPLAVRLPAAIGGAFGVGALYVMARALFDRRTALLAAVLTVGLGWHLNFSRVAFHAIWSVALDALATGLFVVALRRRSASAFAAAGLALGAGVHFYYSSRVLPLVLGIVLLHRLLVGRATFLRQYLPGLVVFGLGTLLAAGPLIQFAVLKPDQFFARADTVSIFNEVQQAGSWKPLQESLRAHALMFNVAGDPNGRHNWSGRPMLDAVVGGLAVLGLALTLLRWRRWEYLLLLAWVPVMMAGGVFSLSWEAPQSLRTIDMVTAAAIFAVLPLAELWRNATFLPTFSIAFATRSTAVQGKGSDAPFPLGVPLRVGGPGLVGLACLGLVCVASWGDVVRYFTRQERDYRTWMEFTTPETETGREINGVPKDWRIYLDPVFVGHPTVTFMVKDPRDYVAFEPSVHLPVVDRAAAIFLSDREPSVAARVRELYPGARYAELRPPNSDHVALYSFFLTPEDIQASQGVVARYRQGDRIVDRVEGRFDLAWPASAPLEPPFDAILSATLTAPTTGSYRLRLSGPAESRAIVDGRPVAVGGGEGALELARGSHALRLEATAAGGEPLRLEWAPPGAVFQPIPATALHIDPVRPTGLLARFYRGREPSGQPALQQIDPTVDLRVHLLPLPRPYTIEWSGAVLAAKEGVYRFGTSSIDSSAVWVDGQQVVANNRPDAYTDGAVRLSPGWHDLTVRFLDATSFTHIELYWEPPGEPRAVVPSRALRPWPAERVGAAEGEQIPVPSARDRSGVPAAEAAGVAAATPAPLPVAASGPSVPAVPIAAPKVEELPLSGGSLRQPRGAAVAADGTVFVADSGRQAVIALPPGGGMAKALAEGQLQEPTAVGVLPDGTLAVADAGLGAVQRIGVDGSVLERLVAQGSLYAPRGLSVTPDGRLLVADTGNNRVVVVSPGGGSRSIGNLDQPTDAVLLADGSIAVAETGASKISVVRIDGQRVASWPMPGAN